MSPNFSRTHNNRFYYLSRLQSYKKRAKYEINSFIFYKKSDLADISLSGHPNYALCIMNHALKTIRLDPTIHLCLYPR